jgi:hypothetical protein
MSALSCERCANQGRAGRSSGTEDLPRALSGPQWQILLSGPTHISPHDRDTDCSAGGHHRQGRIEVLSAGIRRAATLFLYYPLQLLKRKAAATLLSPGGECAEPCRRRHATCCAWVLSGLRRLGPFQPIAFSHSLQVRTALRQHAPKPRKPVKSAIYFVTLSVWILYWVNLFENPTLGDFCLEKAEPNILFEMRYGDVRNYKKNMTNTSFPSIASHMKTVQCISHLKKGTDKQDTGID